MSSLLVLCRASMVCAKLAILNQMNMFRGSVFSFTSAHHSPTDRVGPADAVTKSRTPYRQNSCSLAPWDSKSTGSPATVTLSLSAETIRCRVLRCFVVGKQAERQIGRRLRIPSPTWNRLRIVRVSTIKVAARNDPQSSQFVLRCNISQNRPRFRARADRVSHDRSSLTEASSPSSSKSAS